MREGLQCNRGLCFSCSLRMFLQVFVEIADLMRGPQALCIRLDVACSLHRLGRSSQRPQRPEFEDSTCQFWRLLYDTQRRDQSQEYPQPPIHHDCSTRSLAHTARQLRLRNARRGSALSYQATCNIHGWRRLRKA